MRDLLEKLHACNEAKKWAADKSWPEIYATCHRGDWLLWLFRRTNPEMKREITLAKGHCAATVLHLMKDQRSKDAVQAAIDYGNGLITDEQLKTAAAAAASYAAAADAAAYAAAAADAAAYAAAAADAAAYAAADADAYAYAAAYADADAYAAADAADAARTKNQLETADICRKYLPIKIWNI